MRPRLTFRSDSYRKTRGGYSRLLEIFCGECSQRVLVYQKDGAGPLKRLYLDRILTPEGLVQFVDLPLQKVPDLICPKCQSILGISCVYPEEKRKAFRLFVGAVTKKIKKTT